MKKVAILLCGLGLSVAAVAAPHAAAVKSAKPHRAPQVVMAEHSVNINTADASLLKKVKGIGAKKADAIVAYRVKNGDFRTLDDLTKIKGISQKRLAKISKYITV